MIFINTLTGKKEFFKPVGCGKKVSLYVCGITPYDFAHIGHGRCYVTFDFIYRLLVFLGYEVIYCRNFTDIDDKILKRAQDELGDVSLYPEITKKYIAAYESDMKRLHCLTPKMQPRVTEVISEIIEFVTGLIEKNRAYVHDGSVYFRVSSYADYGKLSKQNIEELLSGARVEVDENKQNPFDFALWKKDDQIGFDSPWGKGRPGWHIECSVMSHVAFGNTTIDIHGGGMDLIFPHHENEIAQSESLYPWPFVRYWIHNAFVRINQEKMSKSLGNFFTLKDVFDVVDPMVLRFYFLKQHYRNPLDFSLQDLQATEKTYKRLVIFFQSISIDLINDDHEVKQNLIVQDMLACLTDDINTSGALGVLFERLSLLQDEHSKKMVKYFLIKVFGLTLEPLPEQKMVFSDEIKALMQQRQKAREEKNWKRADEIRDQLIKLGVEFHDKKLT
ncbi:cysteine--tRNA ligase [Candidatus Dependentiae bacterium]|nr:cysteine--tRNA ligase [Candidatus Dependentiae bacterium]